MRSNADNMLEQLFPYQTHPTQSSGATQQTQKSPTHIIHRPLPEDITLYHRRRQDRVAIMPPTVQDQKRAESTRAYVKSRQMATRTLFTDLRVCYAAFSARQPNKDYKSTMVVCLRATTSRLLQTRVFRPCACLLVFCHRYK